MHSQYIGDDNTKPTLIFLHGWCCSPQDYQLQVEYFKNNYSILIPDYSKIIVDINLDSEQLLWECVNKLKEYIQSIKLTNFIVVGHSMGGVMALALANHFKIEQIGTVIIDTAIPLSIDRRHIFSTLIKDLDTDLGKNTLSTIIDKKWINPAYDNLSLMQQKKIEMLSMWEKSPKNFNKLLLLATQFDSTTAIKNYNGSLMYIAATPANGDIMALKEASTKLQIAEILSGHFIMQNKPNELNNLLTQFFHNFI